MGADRAVGEWYLVRLDEPLHLSARGEWFQGGKPFTNRKVADLFTRSVIFDEQTGAWMVAIGHQKAGFTSEDTQVFVVELSEEGVAHLSSDAFEPLAVLVTKSNAWCLSSPKLPGVGRARFLPGLQQQLSEHVVEESEGRLAVKLPGCCIELRYER
jgi:hypothetical protein